MPTRATSKLPDMGEWQVVSGFMSSDAPFGILHVEFGTAAGKPATGWVRWRDRTSPLSHISEFADDKFNAMYDMWGHKGMFEAAIRPDQTVELTFVETKHQPALTCRTVVLDIKSNSFSAKVANMSPTEKLDEVIKRSLPLMPAGMAEHFKPLLSAAGLSTIAGTIAIWAGSHFIGVGELADVAMILFGLVVFGTTALDIADELLEFARAINGARSEDALDAAAKHLANAVSIGGANVVLAMLFGKAPKVLRDVYTGKPTGLRPPAVRTTKGTAAEFTAGERGQRLAFEIKRDGVRAPDLDPELEAAAWRFDNQTSPRQGFPWKPDPKRPIPDSEIDRLMTAYGGEPSRRPSPPLPKHEIASRQRVGPVWDPLKQPLPESPGKLFYQPKFQDVPASMLGERTRGATNLAGDIKILDMLKGFDRYHAIGHELMHRTLTPRLQLLRNIRVQLKQGSYSRSYILRYIEETMAEGRGLLTKSYFEGDAAAMRAAFPAAVKFPVKNGYVTVAKIGEEARGILQGPVIVGGETYLVWFDPILSEDEDGN